MSLTSFIDTEAALNNTQKLLESTQQPLLTSNTNSSSLLSDTDRSIPTGNTDAEKATYNENIIDTGSNSQTYKNFVNRAFDAAGKNYQYPFWGIWAERAATFPWVILEACPNMQAGASARSAFKRQLGKEGQPIKTFKLILQDKDFGWGLSHTWEAYKGWASPLNNSFAGIYAGIKNGADSVKGTGNAAVDVVKGGKSLAEAFNNIQAESAYVRHDQSQVYANSGNRRISFSFEFMTPPNQSDAHKMWDIIKSIEESSCAQSTDVMAFTPPEIWNIKIMAPQLGDGVKPSIWALNFCALKDVKTSISGPWKGGYPAKIEIGLDFEHLPPVFKDNGWWAPGGGGMPQKTEMPAEKNKK